MTLREKRRESFPESGNSKHEGKRAREREHGLWAGAQHQQIRGGRPLQRLRDPHRASLWL